MEGKMRGLARSVIVLCLGIGFSLLAACSSQQDSAPPDSVVTAEVETEPTATSFAAVNESTPLPTATQAPSATPEPSPTNEASSGLDETSPYAELLSFVPSRFVDMHLPVSFGPAIYLLDLDQVRADLGIGSINGASDYREKLDLVIALGEASQGLPIYPETVFPIGSSAFDEWGWDFADVNTALHLPDFGATVLSGDFSRQEVIQKLEQNGVRWPDPNISDFSIYSVQDDTAAVAMKPDTLIVVKGDISAEPIYDKNDVIATLIVTDFEFSGIGEHPVVDELLTELSDYWGVVLTASPDVVAHYTALSEDFASSLPPSIAENYEEMFNSTLAPLPWDIMAVGFTNTDTGTDLILAYHYPAGGIAPTEMDVARTALTEPTSLQYRNLQLIDMLQLNDMQIGDDLFVVNATTKDRAFLGNALENRDYSIQLGLLLIREE
jgi:hypothetical protein